MLEWRLEIYEKYVSVSCLVCFPEGRWMTCMWYPYQYFPFRLCGQHVEEAVKKRWFKVEIRPFFSCYKVVYCPSLFSLLLFWKNPWYWDNSLLSFDLNTCQPKLVSNLTLKFQNYFQFFASLCTPSSFKQISAIAFPAGDPGVQKKCFLENVWFVYS